ncbi:glycosyltransferase family 2 protein [Thalassobius sp. I31.1]|uniref:glycosyltransferase family 2 protein n=1 Tax=Thalassobius sp. I31.1 TaxID=2109912 RepID=UPI000D1C031F|nr:glycosyltransferase family 2 protein [Thalassobius sp. I31.1]
MHATTLVTIAKDEGPFFWEWVAHHRLVGFDNIIVYQNDSSDLTHAILKVLESIGAIRYFYNDADPNMHQVRAYRRVTLLDEYQNADWVMALDMDEFLVVNTGDRTIQALIDALPETDEVFINWKRFGSSFQTKMSPSLVTERFIRAEAHDRVSKAPSPHKALFRPERFRRPGVHRPVPKESHEDTTFVNGSGMPKGTFRFEDWRSMDPGNRALAQVNHYIIKDAQSFTLKVARGRAHQVENQVNTRYWDMHNYNSESDSVLFDRSAKLKEEMARLDAMAGNQLSELTERSFGRHQKRFSAELENPAMRDLYIHCLENIVGYT